MLYVRFLRGRGPVTDLERWQTNYLPVFAVWPALVVIVFPPLFGHIRASQRIDPIKGVPPAPSELL